MTRALYILTLHDWDGELIVSAVEEPRSIPHELDRLGADPNYHAWVDEWRQIGDTRKMADLCGWRKMGSYEFNPHGA